MKKIINIKYSSIFKYDTHKETIKYNEIGVSETTTAGTRISFTAKETSVQVLIGEDTVWLTNNQSTLQLVKGKRIKNIYTTMYGDVHIDTFMESFENNGNIKIKYKLYDQEHCLSEVYILLQIQVMENDNENT